MTGKPTGRPGNGYDGETPPTGDGSPPLPPLVLKASFDAEALAAGAALFRLKWRFLKGVAKLEQLPPTDLPEIAFAGRSNVGKSSLINAVTGVNGLARTSNTPGRTQELNYFTAEAAPLLILDMPGYGYAEAPKATVEAWTLMIRTYLQGRQTLRRVFQLIDSRHGVMASDREMMALMDNAAVTYQVVLTKTDKITERALQAVLAETSEVIRKRAAAFPIVLTTSAEKAMGIAELRATIAGIC